MPGCEILSAAGQKQDIEDMEPISACLLRALRIRVFTKECQGDARKFEGHLNPPDKYNFTERLPKAIDLLTGAELNWAFGIHFT